MALEDTIKDSLVLGNVYGIRIDEYRYEGTYAGKEGNTFILRSGNKYSPKGEKIPFDRQELSLSLKESIYPL